MYVIYNFAEVEQNIPLEKEKQTANKTKWNCILWTTFEANKYLNNKYVLLGACCWEVCDRVAGCKFFRRCAE